MTNKPGLTDEDAALWRGVMKDISPLRGPGADKRPPPDVPDRPEEAPAARVAPRAAGAAPTGGLDGRTRQRLQRGQIPIDSRLDLHGMTQAEARSALTRELAAAQERCERCVLVITGKGDIDGGTGVIRRSMPGWLEDEWRVLDFSPARARHGGAGAFYVLLRKARPRQDRRAP